MALSSCRRPLELIDSELRTVFASEVGIMQSALLLVDGVGKQGVARVVDFRSVYLQLLGLVKHHDILGLIEGWKEQSHLLPNEASPTVHDMRQLIQQYKDDHSGVHPSSWSLLREQWRKTLPVCNDNIVFPVCFSLLEDLCSHLHTDEETQLDGFEEVQRQSVQHIANGLIEKGYLARENSCYFLLAGGSGL
eukprot:3938242-Rhodomonas_salina.1